MPDAAEKLGKKVPEAIEVDLELCKSCGICAALCPTQVFDRDEFGRPLVARLGDCISCSFCERHCPDFAIEIRWRARRRRVAPEGAPAAGATRRPRKSPV